MAKKTAEQPKAARPTRVTQTSARQRTVPQGNAPNASAGVDDEAEDTTYPKALYRKVRPSVKYPNGYETRRVKDETQEADLVGQGWKTSPEGMAPEFPHGHQD